MKKIILLSLPLTLTSIAVLASVPSGGDGCNMSLAYASGKYLLELESAGLGQYQGGGACNILDAEFRKCTPKQKARLMHNLEIREILGNICMPHLPPPKR